MSLLHTDDVGEADDDDNDDDGDHGMLRASNFMSDKYSVKFTKKIIKIIEKKKRL